jgi:hypothetical protein
LGALVTVLLTWILRVLGHSLGSTSNQGNGLVLLTSQGYKRGESDEMRSKGHLSLKLYEIPSYRFLNPGCIITPGS